MDFEQFTEGRRLSPRDKKKEDDLIKGLLDDLDSEDDFDRVIQKMYIAKKKAKSVYPPYTHFATGKKIRMKFCLRTHPLFKNSMRQVKVLS